jgi:transcriptional regulator with PAS, ATPase and Fis domain
MKMFKTQVRDKSKFSNIIGSTPAMYEVFSLIENVCRFDTTVLITGESGTGKELVARSIHANSSRSNNLLIPINCATIPENLQESEFFGYKKGSFTDANEDKKGLFEDAHQGTVFLDEIADASPSTQLKLLRFLENGEIRRIGENTPTYVDVRLITATNKNLQREIENGSFREDLYYRINVVEIHLPPLRERKDDIPLLAEHFLHIHVSKSKKDIRNISRQAMQILLQYDWPGNIRELQSVIQYSVAFCNKNVITPEFLPENIQNVSKKIKINNKSGQMSLDEIKNEYIFQMLEKLSWNYSKASEILGISRATLYRKIKESNRKSNNKSITFS